MPKTQYHIQDHVAIIQLDSPPLNTLGFEMRNSIAEGINNAVIDNTIKAIILIGSDRAFSGGADITEFGKNDSFKQPHLLTLIEIVESCPKPVIVAIAGVCMGGGLELSLACHFRVAKPDASIGLPEVKIGIIPGAGGTQRLPRLVGVEIALNMIVSGNPVPAAMLKNTQLFDELISGDLKDGALLFAKKVISEKRPIKLARDIKIKYPYAEAYFQFARNMIAAVSKNYPAPLKAIDAIAAAVFQPFEKGMQLERENIMAMMMTPESSSLRHLFFAERACSKIADIPSDTPMRTIAKVAVIGAGTMGSGISMNFLNAGIPVTLIEADQTALDRGVGSIRKLFEGSMKKGKLTPEQVAHLMGLLTPSISIEDVKDADLIIEAVFEQMDVKEEVFRTLDAFAKPGAILATNTSTLDVNQIANFTKRPQDVLGMHFFSPANVMKLLEVVRGAATAKDVMNTVMQLSKKIKKIAVVSGVCDGFIGNRMINQYFKAVMTLLELGASPYQIDKALEKWGMMMGPFRMSDLAGNDIGWLIRKRNYIENPTFKQVVIADRLCEMGRFGQKTGAGWYRYEPGNRDPLADPVVEKLIADYRKEIGVVARKISDKEIIDRCIFSLVNEGAKIVEEGIAARASDIDIIYLYGYGFPAFRGGPMHYASQFGLYNMRLQMQQFANGGGEEVEFWKPAQLLEQLVKENNSFS